MKIKTIFIGIIFVTFLTSLTHGDDIKFGELSNKGQHGVAGSVHVKDDDEVILVRDFEYDGKCQDTFFMAGTKDVPSPSNEGIILSHTFDGTFYSYTNDIVPNLEGSSREDKIEITLKIPNNLKVNELKWLSVWCRTLDLDLGSLMFPENLLLSRNSPPLKDTTDNESDVETELQNEHHNGVTKGKSISEDNEETKKEPAHTSNTDEGNDDDTHYASEISENTDAATLNRADYYEHEEAEVEIERNSVSFGSYIFGKIDELSRLVNALLVIGWFAGWYFLYENCHNFCKWLSQF